MNKKVGDKEVNILPVLLWMERPYYTPDLFGYCYINFMGRVTD